MEKMEPEIMINVKTLLPEIASKVNSLAVDHLYSYTPCIYRVSTKPRMANEAAYMPRLVSIGPLHRQKGQLQAMESYKVRCLQNLLIRFGVDLRDLLAFVAHQESYVRGCYEDKIGLSPKKLSEMILFDGIFIVELLLKNHFPHLRDRSDTMFENRWMWNDLLHDMLLLENQLPMKVTKGLLRFVDESFLQELSIYDLAHELFRNIVGNKEKLPLTENCYNARHFVEFLLYLYRPAHPRDEPSSSAKKFENTRCATELQQAGVEFRRGSGSSFFQVVFDKGCLEIPSFTVNDSTETFFRNIIAFEQYSYHSKDITSYVMLMDGLINTQEDVALLAKRGIVNNELSESQAVADLFNSLYKEVVTDASDFYFAKLCQDLNKYSRDGFHQLKASCFQWRQMLRKDYFSNPWAAISVFAASLLLCLSAIQTVCSVLQVKSGAGAGAGAATPPL